MAPRTLAACLCAVFSLAASPAQQDEDVLQGDAARLQGKWVAKVGANRDVSVVLEIKGHKATATFIPSEGDKQTLRGNFRLDDKAKPKTLDWIHFKAPDGADLPDNLAVYELTDDTFRVRNGGPNNPRPAKLDTGEGGPGGLLVFHREKVETRAQQSE